MYFLKNAVFRSTDYFFEFVRIIIPTWNYEHVVCLPIFQNNMRLLVWLKTMNDGGYMQSEHDDERLITCTSACSNQQTKDIMSANHHYEARSKKIIPAKPQ